MNSEMELDPSPSRQSRRYIHGLAREPAPLLPWIGEPGLAESSTTDLFDFDFRSVGEREVDAGGGAEEGEGEGDSGNLGVGVPTSALDYVDLSDIERRLEGALAGFDVPACVDEPIREEGRASLSACSSSSVACCSSPSPNMPMPSKVCLPEKENEKGGDQEGEDEEDDDEDISSSVWEDGEKFWERTSLSTIPGSSPSDAEKLRALQTPPVGFSVSGKRGFGERRGRLQRSPGVVATPRSLYDADGFLRS